MDPIARIAFSKSLVDPKQPASMKVLQNPDGSFVLQLQIGLLAEGKPYNDKPSDDDKKNKRDAAVGAELCGSATLNIAMSKISDTDGAANFEIVLTGPGGTKIPGTGFGIKPLNMDFVEIKKEIKK